MHNYHLTESGTEQVGSWGGTGCSSCWAESSGLLETLQEPTCKESWGLATAGHRESSVSTRQTIPRLERSTNRSSQESTTSDCTNH